MQITSMDHDIHHGMIARDEYVVTHGTLPDVLGRGTMEHEIVMASSNLMLVNNVPQKRPSVSPMETRDAKKPRSKSLQFICTVPECAEKFNNQEHLDTHMKLHFGVKPFTCDVCGKVCQTESRLKTHQAFHVNDGVKPKCDVCERSFSSRSALNKHKKMLHKPKPHVCPHCNSGFEEHKYMVIHAKRSHDADLSPEVKESELPTSSDYFEVDNFDSNSNLNECKHYFKENYSVPIDENPLTHTAISNNSLEPPKENSQSELSVLQKKIAIPSPTSVCPLITCEFCSSTFPSLAYLEQHMEVHLGEKTYACHNCGVSVSSLHDLSNHLKLHIAETESTNFITSNSNGHFSQFVPLPMQPVPTRAPQMFDKYICVICNEQFLNLGSLKRHQAKGHNTAMLSI
nr:zinc finger protein 62-like [Cherax quadricarinatus]XP_053642310.1 zinc finger protein 62-like [Cherax quadricarinatus]XP_053642311.1 zinc finger protein 62-like [Cherax quadricarinatus]XP_053642312.1 zinc finger protein 62-like [Cherax quadricarinatus]